MLDTITLLNLKDLFTVKKLETIPYEMPDNTWFSVSFEMDLNVMHYERK